MIDAKKTTLIIARSGILLALAIVFQYVGGLIPEPFLKQLVVGSLVNLCLFLTLLSSGLICAVVVGFLTPVFAMLFGIVAMPPLIPFIGLGNVLMVVSFYFVVKLLKKEKVGFFVAVAVSAIIKFCFMYFVVLSLAPMLLGKPAAPAALQLNFSYPQLITALIGGVIAYFVERILKKAKLF